MKLRMIREVTEVERMMPSDGFLSEEDTILCKSITEISSSKRLLLFGKKNDMVDKCYQI